MDIRQTHQFRYNQETSQIAGLVVFGGFPPSSATDIAGNSLFAVQLPQIAPIIILLPVMTIFYSLNRYGMMNPRYIAASEIILTKTSQDKVYSNLSWALLVGGVVSYFVQYLYYGDFLRPLYSSAFILVLGIFVSILKATRIDGNMKDIFLVSIIFAAIPSITLIFIKYGSVTVWSVSFLFIVIAMIFNRPIVLFSISVSINIHPDTHMDIAAECRYCH